MDLQEWKLHHKIQDVTAFLSTGSAGWFGYMTKVRFRSERQKTRQLLFDSTTRFTIVNLIIRTYPDVVLCNTHVWQTVQVTKKDTVAGFTEMCQGTITIIVRVTTVQLCAKNFCMLLQSKLTWKVMWLAHAWFLASYSCRNTNEDRVWTWWVN